MAAGDIDGVDFIAPEAAGVRPEKQVKPDDRKTDANGDEPFRPAKKKFESLRHARQLNKSAGWQQANFARSRFIFRDRKSGMESE
jgi:hypothetical protein